MPAGTVTGENQEITYQLPAGVRPIQDESGTVYQSNTPVGTYTIGTDGKITITFNDNFATGEAFSGNITFQGTAEKQGSGDSSDIDFGGDTGKVTIKVVKVSADGTVSDVNISGKVSDTNDASNNKLPGFTVDNLPELGAGEKYILTYDVVLDGTAGDGSGQVGNAAEADGGNSHGNMWHTETIESRIQKKRLVRFHKGPDHVDHHRQQLRMHHER